MRYLFERVKRVSSPAQAKTLRQGKCKQPCSEALPSTNPHFLVFFRAFLTALTQNFNDGRLGTN